ncbi:MAG: TetR/AcrR family transcriptional regulator [Gammaproteobacteria bacterium]
MKRSTTKQTAGHGKPLTARGEATRRRILEAAELEFGEKGFHAASVSSITTRAKVAQGTFYIYFAAKDDCFLALVREVGHELRHQTGEAMAHSATRLEAERRGLEAFLRFTARHPGLYRIVQESQFVDEAVFREYYEKIAEGYVHGLREAARRGELSAGDAEVRAWALMGIGHFLGMRYCLWRKRVPDARVLDEVMAFVAHGLAPAERLGKL